MHFFTPQRCQTSNKIMYHTKVQALQAADEGYRTRGQHLWVYQCAYCGTWHLTHRPPEPDFAAGAKNTGRKPISRKRGYKPRHR
ncbi:MAG: hypothetical protein LKJ44_08240 [Bifidobacteriaceae bacterium]|nr:hypothetical protein [Bifidobacteriaceae bacterium]MCI1979673.1 hypothetical protein [Bifidobacteriaceae bacterium]